MQHYVTCINSVKILLISQNFTNKAFNMLLNTQNIKHRIQNIVHLKTSTFKYNHNHSKSRKYEIRKTNLFEMFQNDT